MIIEGVTFGFGLMIGIFFFICMSQDFLNNMTGIILFICLFSLFIIFVNDNEMKINYKNNTQTEYCNCSKLIVNQTNSLCKRIDNENITYYTGDCFFNLKSVCICYGDVYK